MLEIIGKNIRHRPFRSGALILAFAFIAASLFTGHYLMTGATESVKSGVSRMGADMVVVPERYKMEAMDIILRGEPSTFFFDSRLIPKIEAVEGVAAVAPNLYIASLDASCCAVPVQLIAFDPVQDFTLEPWLKEPQHHVLGKDEIFVGDRIIGDIGTPLEFYGHNFTIVNRLDPSGMGVDCSIFMRFEDAYTMAAESPERAVQTLTIPEGRVSAVLVKAENVRDSRDIAARIEASVPTVRVLTPMDQLHQISGDLNAAVKVIDLAGLAAALISLPLIALVSLMAANERRREIGVLRALGATRSYVFRLIIGESLIVAAIGSFIGIASAWVLLIMFKNYISVVVGIPLLMPGIGSLTYGAGTAIILTVGIGAVAALYPSVQSARMEPYEAMRSGEL
jgi:putative ABC transport system permease protein